MSDHKADLLVPDSRVVSLDEARAEGEARKRVRRPGDPMADYATRGDMLNGMLKVGEKLYNEIAADVQGELESFSVQTAEHLERMEYVITQRVLATVERKTLRYQFRVRWATAQATIHSLLVEVGIINPIPKSARHPRPELVPEAEYQSDAGSGSDPMEEPNGG